MEAISVNVVKAFEVQMDSQELRTAPVYYKVNNVLFTCKGMATLDDDIDPMFTLYYEKVEPTNDKGVGRMTADQIAIVAAVAIRFDVYMSMVVTESLPHKDIVFAGRQFHSTSDDNVLFCRTV